MNNYSIYTDDPQTSKLIPIVYKYIKSINQYADFHIFSNNELFFHNSNIGSLSTYYIKFYQGHVIFCNIKDYLEYKDTLINKCFLIGSVDDLIASGYSKHKLGDTVLLTIDGDTIHEI